MLTWLSSTIVFIILLTNSCMIASQTKMLKLQHGGDAIRSVRYTGDGKRFVSASFDGTVVMWDARSGRQIWQTDLDGGVKTNSTHTISKISDMDLSPDAAIIAVAYSQDHVIGDTLQGNSNYRIGLLDSNTGREIKILSGHRNLIGRIAFSPNSKLLLSESADGTARLWNIDEGQEAFQIKLKERGAAVAFSPNGKLFAVATQPVYGVPPQPIVGLYDAKSGDLLHEFSRRKNAVTSLNFSPDGQTLAIASGDQSGSEIQLWELGAQEPRRVFTNQNGNIRNIAFSPNGHWLASGGVLNGHGIVVIRDLTTNGEPRIHKLGGNVNALDFSPDGKHLVVGADSGQIVVLPV